MGDTTVENALIRAARRGVDVQICGENESGEYDRAYAKLARAGIRISYYSSSSGFYIHGKVIEADYGTPRAKTFIGSENFSSTSLNDNRELGLITSTPPSWPRSPAPSPPTSGTASTGRSPNGRIGEALPRTGVSDVQTQASLPVANRSQGEGAAIPVGLDPRVASSAYPDLQDVGHPARRGTEPDFQAVRVGRAETGHPRRRHHSRVHVRRRPPAAHPRVSRPDPQLPAAAASEFPRLRAPIHPHGIPRPARDPA